MNLVNSVFELANKFMSNSKYVKINTKQIDHAANDLKNKNIPIFPTTASGDIYKICIIELVASSINYCYWYGSAYIRHCDSSSGKLKNLINKAFNKFNKDGGINSFNCCLDHLIELLSIERFPLIEERIKHINELKETGQKFINQIVYGKQLTFNDHLNIMIRSFPGFASDLFLKRAFLFFGQLNCFFNLFEEEMHNLPIPADYQIPKMLEAENLIIYNSELSSMIKNEILIPKGSLYECEIRAASIIACKQLGDKLGWTMPQIDGYFWLRRKEITVPYHLCVTTDY